MMLKWKVWEERVARSAQRTGAVGSTARLALRRRQAVDEGRTVHRFQARARVHGAGRRPEFSSTARADREVPMQHRSYHHLSHCQEECVLRWLSLRRFCSRADVPEVLLRARRDFPARRFRRMGPSGHAAHLQARW